MQVRCCKTARMLFNLIFKNTMRRRLGFKFRSGTFQTTQPKILTVSVLSEILKKNTAITTKYQFHTSPTRNAPPIVVLLLRYAVKFGAIVSGRMIRKWWMKLSPEERQKVLRKIGSKKSKIAFGGTIFVGCMLIYYIEHIVEDPITKRKRFIMLNQKQMTQIGEFEFYRQMQLFKSYVVPPSHPIHRRVVRVANNLILSNSDLKEIKNKVWSITVIDRPEITNAFALPHGKIFVFSGMLNVCTNDDQLAVVLAHEIAHSILCHVAESMSRVFLIDFLLLLPTLIFWVIFPDVWAIFSEWITSNLSKIFFQLPFSRAIEKEADVVGLHLAARSCFDVREAPVFWRKMKYVSKDFPFEWLSTHPSHESRQLELNDLLPQALHIREVSNCPPLSPRLRYW